MTIESTYIQYGVRSDWAKDYAEINLPATTFKSTSKKNLIDKYQIPGQQVDLVKECLKRKPLDENILNNLLSRNRYVCCICRGTKSDAYIIHHIEPYAKTQDNSYANLAVLCPNDHDLAHREGQKLTNSLTANQIREQRRKWEKTVEELDVQAASGAGEIREIDFINIPRVLQLYSEVFKKAPETDYTERLLAAEAITSTGDLNNSFIQKHNKNPATPFIFFGPNGSWNLSNHYTDAFKQILPNISFTDLDTLLNKKTVVKENLIGKFCYYVGGLYGKKPSLPLTDTTEPTHLYFHRKDYFIEWMVDAKYMVSNTSLHRLSDHNEYLIYGRIRNVGTKEHNGKSYIHIDIRPYLFGIPTKTKSRKPYIHFIDKYPDFEFEDEK